MKGKHWLGAVVLLLIGAIASDKIREVPVIGPMLPTI
jgi:hypothetical protein